MGKIKAVFLAGVVLGLAFNTNAQTAAISSFNAVAVPVQSIGVVSAQPDSIVQIAAESQGLSTIAREDLPRGSTYWWLQSDDSAIPTPFPSADMSQPIYQIADGQFLVDQTGGQVFMKRRQLGSGMATDSVAAAVAAQADAVVNLIGQVQAAGSPVFSVE